MNIELELIFII